MNTEHFEEAEVTSNNVGSSPSPLVEKEREKIEFKPGANYQWQPDNQFVISGAELNVIHNTLHLVFNDTRLRDPQVWVMLQKVYELSSAVIKRGVEEGIILLAEEKVKK